MVQVLKLIKPEGISIKKEIGEETGLEGSQLKYLPLKLSFWLKLKLEDQRNKTLES